MKLPTLSIALAVLAVVVTGFCSFQNSPNKININSIQFERYHVKGRDLIIPFQLELKVGIDDCYLLKDRSYFSIKGIVSDKLISKPAPCQWYKTNAGKADTLFTSKDGKFHFETKLIKGDTLVLYLSGYVRKCYCFDTNISNQQ